MARQIDVIDLTENDESHQDKVNRLEATVASQKQRIDDLTNLIFTLMNARYVEHNISSSGSGAHVAPIYTVAPPTMNVAPAFKCNAQQFPNLYALMLEKEFGGLSRVGNEKSNGGELLSVKESNDIMTDGNGLLSKIGLGEAVSENLNALDSDDMPTNDGTGNPRDHVEAFLDWLARCRLRREHDLVKRYEPSNQTFARGNPLKRKSVESQGEPVAITLRSDKRKCGLVEAQSKDKGKAVMPTHLPTMVEKPYATKQMFVNPDFRSSCPKGHAFAFTRLPESYASLFERLKRFNLVYPIKSKPYWSHKSENYGKFCVYHSGMQGHHIEECIPFKKEVESLINSGQVKVVPKNGIGEPFVAILPYAKGNSSKKAI